MNLPLLLLTGDKDLLQSELTDLRTALAQSTERNKFKRRSYGEVKNNEKVADPIIQENTEYGNVENLDGFPEKQVEEERKTRRNKKKIKNKVKEADPTLQEIMNFDAEVDTLVGLPKKQVEREKGNEEGEDGIVQEYDDRMEYGKEEMELVPNKISSDAAGNSEGSGNLPKRQMVGKSKPIDDDRDSINGGEPCENYPEMNPQDEQNIPENQLGLPDPWGDECFTLSDSELDRRMEEQEDRNLANRMEGLNNLEESGPREMKEYYIKLKAYQENSVTLRYENEELRVQNLTLIRKIERLTTCVTRLQEELDKRRMYAGEIVRIATTSHQLTAASAISSDSGCVELSLDDPERRPFKLGNEPFTQAQKDKWTEEEVRRRYKKFTMIHPATGEQVTMFHVVANVNILYALWKMIKNHEPEKFLREFIPAAWTLIKLCNRGYKVVKTTVSMVPHSPRKCFTPKK
ncbi:hypothetical protein QAD02_021295 [Eretmocerus hayati]|uniref:Uncharacterized protein n=1 Tax=Eretmocerus hayati TaxID=131215 RepID=A0ACC2PQ27_9HYME|nr:hypothetical protein QAD02_021295 [Eretmocerus hayati]